MAFFRAHFLLIILLPLCIGATAASYYRFLVADNYVVAYEGDCDPYAASCFIGYDEDSGDNYYYAKVRKYAPDVRAECGEDVTGCEDASVCLPQDRDCSVTFCSADTTAEGDTCENLSAAEKPAEGAAPEDAGGTGKEASSSETGL